MQGLVVAAVEPPFARLQEQIEALRGDAVEAAQMPLRLVPEILDPIDVSPLVPNPLRRVDPHMVEGRDIQGIIAAKAVRVDDAVGPDHALDHRPQRGGPHVRDHHRVDLAAALEQPKHGDFSRRASAALACPDAAEVALVHFDLAGHGRRRCQLFGHHVTQPRVEASGRVPVHATQFCRRPGRGSRYQVLQQTIPGLPAHSAPSFIHPAILASQGFDTGLLRDPNVAFDTPLVRRVAPPSRPFRAA